MHSVTSNAVSKALSYSMTEHKTGKKFIDGNDIYSKTLAIGHPVGASANTSLYIADNVGYVIKVEFITTKINGDNNWQFFEQGAWGDNFDCTISYYRTAQNYLQLKYGSAYASWDFSLFITVEYTKTTN